VNANKPKRSYTVH